MKIFTREVARSIIDEFEDLLDENNIDIPDECREGDPDEARLYGFAYDDLLTKVEQEIVSLCHLLNAEYVTDTWNRGNWYTFDNLKQVSIEDLAKEKIKLTVKISRDKDAFYVCYGGGEIEKIPLKDLPSSVRALLNTYVSAEYEPVIKATEYEEE